MVDSKRPDLNFEVGYDLKSQKATFSIGISNIFERVGKRQFGFSASRWWTKRKGKVDAKHLLPLTSATRPDGREEEIHTQRDQQLTKVSSAVTQLTQDADDWITDHKPESLNADTLKSDIRAALNGALAPWRLTAAGSRTHAKNLSTVSLSIRNSGARTICAGMPKYLCSF